MPTKIDKTLLYSVIEVAHICQVEPVTINTWIKKGKLEAVNIAGAYFIKEPDLLAYINNQLEKAEK
jgi:predicted site-specific integrase-resolvase